jgi:hypothetical protein
VLGSGITGDGNDAYVKQINKEFIGCDFLRFFGAP